MKASICTKYGVPHVLQVRDVEKPTVRENEVLIKIHASSVTTAEGMMREGKPYIGRLFTGLLKPKNAITGTGLAGTIHAIGDKVNQFAIGDDVFGESIEAFATNAEYISLDETGLLIKRPKNMTFQELAPICDGALTSINFLKDVAKIKQGQKVLINGAAGSLGTAAIQLAKHYGAEVTGVCSASSIPLVKSLGADKVIDYNIKDFTKTENLYDIIYDTIGKSSFPQCKSSLTRNGIYMSPVLSVSLLFRMFFSFSSKKAKFSATGIRPINDLKALLHELVEILETGHMKMVIDRTYPLHQITEAHSYVAQGHKKGNVVIVSL
tara:strand:+ start:552 stop:1520 length:969 start_codon:yes stop_codon:yes gene_type:complete